MLSTLPVCSPFDGDELLLAFWRASKAKPAKC